MPFQHIAVNREDERWQAPMPGHLDRPSVPGEVIEMLISGLRTRRSATSSVAFSLVALVLALVATAVVIAAGLGMPLNEPGLGPAVSPGPTACLFEGRPAPCS